MKLHEKNVILERYAVEGNKTTRGIVELWDAVDRQLERPVIIQIMSEEGARDPEASSTFLKCQQIASSIHHSSVQGVYDAGVWEDRPFSVMQKCDGVPASDLYRPGNPPDLPIVLAAARQVAEGLQACRDAGIRDWQLSPDLVLVDAGGNAHFPIIEGPPLQDNAAGGPDDIAPLNELLRLMLTGRPDADRAVLQRSLVSAGVIALVERLHDLQHDPDATASDVAGELAAIEAAAMQPTQAYNPEVLAVEGANGRPGAHATAPAARLDPSEAPTLAAPLMQTGMPYNSAVEISPTAPQDTSHKVVAGEPALAGRAYVSSVVEKSAPTRTLRRPLTSLLPLLGLLLLVVLAFVLVRLVGDANSAGGQPSASASVEVSPTPATITAPNVLGKSLDDAAIEVKSAGLELFQTDAVYNDAYAADKVASQVPAPGELLQAGSYITVSLSLGPQSVANTPAPNPPADNPLPKPPPNKDKPDNNGKHKGKDK
jgi:serine/threonine-protein kinase